jgi:hypothetical protein
LRGLLRLRRGERGRAGEGDHACHEASHGPSGKTGSGVGRGHVASSSPKRSVMSKP